jgi:hypothetical protein
MKRRLTQVLTGRRLLLIVGVSLLLFAVAAPLADASDVYGNIGPAPLVPAGGWFGRYPISSYQLDQYFPAISVGVFSGIDTSGLLPMVAYFLAQVIWLITAFISNTIISLFALAYSLDLVNGNGTAGSGALGPVSQAIQNIYHGAFGAPWLIVAVSLVAAWAMWNALVQRRYQETATSLFVSLIYCVVAIGIVTQPQATIGPASRYANELSTSLLSITSTGSVTGEAAAKQAASNQLFTLLVVQPWTVLEFGGIEHCTTTSAGKTVSIPVRPLSPNPTEENRLAGQLETASEINAPAGKTCVNALVKYAPHFLAYPFQSKERGQEHEALEHGDTSDLPESDPGKLDGTYHLGPGDEPAAEAMGKGGQYQRLLLALVIAFGSLGTWLLLGALAIGVLIAGVFLLLTLAFAPFALVIGVIPGRGHAFFRAWISRLAGYLLRKAIYSALLAVILAVSSALEDATSSLGWLMAFALQALFMWALFLQRNRIVAEFLAITAGRNAGRDEGVSRLQSLYYTTRLARMGGLHREHPVGGGHGQPAALPTEPPNPADTPDADTTTATQAPVAGSPLAHQPGDPDVEDGEAPDPAGTEADADLGDPFGNGEQLRPFRSDPTGEEPT